MDIENCLKKLRRHELEYTEGEVKALIKELDYLENRAKHLPKESGKKEKFPIRRGDKEKIFSLIKGKGEITENGLNVKAEIFSLGMSAEKTACMLRGLLPLYVNLTAVTEGRDFRFFEGKNLSFGEIDSMNMNWEELDGRLW
ncbi:MAG: hypothetical protein Q4C42_04515 [Clostridia bacterium]|nr:hypothetical protein [Clostridia bacterium]